MLILENFTAACRGNRQIADQNTEDISRNRKAIVKECKANDAVQLNFAESRFNEAWIDYLEHCAAMNKRVALGNQKMAEINTLLIEVNQQIMEGNAEIVAFNSKHTDISSKLISGELTLEATPEANVTRIERNKTRIGEINAQAIKNRDQHDSMLELTKEYSKEIVVSRGGEAFAAVEADGSSIASDAACNALAAVKADGSDSRKLYIETEPLPQRVSEGFVIPPTICDEPISREKFGNINMSTSAQNLDLCTVFDALDDSRMAPLAKGSESKSCESESCPHGNAWSRGGHKPRPVREVINATEPPAAHKHRRKRQGCRGH